MAERDISYEIIEGNVIINFNKFCDYASSCQEEEIGKDIDRRTHSYTDAEVAYDAIKGFLRNSIEQLSNGKKVILTRNGSSLMEFSDIESFKTWVYDFFEKTNNKFIQKNLVDVAFK